MRWTGEIVCDGGPVFVGSLPVFKGWTGGRPLPKEERTSLHLWGQFLGDLPERFRPRPTGHQWLEGDLKALWNDLVDTLDTTWPDAAWDADPELLRAAVQRRDGKQLWFELAPISEYERSWQAHQSDEIWLHRFDDHTALFWDVEGPGRVSIGEASDTVVLVRSWIDEDSHREAVRAAARGPVEWHGELSHSSDRLVVAWSQIDGAELPINVRAGTQIDGPGQEGLGHVVKLRSGNYRYGVAVGEGDGWSARWCRLERC